MSGFQDSISRIVITRFMRVIHSFYARITRTNRRMNPLVLLIYLFSFATSAPSLAQTITTCDASNEAAINLNTYAGYEPDGLIGHWSLNEGPAGPYVDSSPTANNAVNSQTGNNPVQGIMNNGVSNDNGVAGDRGGIIASSNATYTSLSAFTISMWVNAEGDTKNNGGLFSLGTFSGVTNFGLLAASRETNAGSRRLIVVAPGWSGTQGVWRYNDIFDDKKWVHLTITYDVNDPPGTAPKLYKNGVSAVLGTTNSTTSGSPLTHTTIDFLFGRRHGSSWFSDPIDEVRLYNRVLSQAEIQGLYKQRLEYCDGTSWIHMVDKPCPSGIASCGGNPNERLAFVTNATYASESGGIAGQDAICQAEANAAGLHGTYYAWVAGSASSPSSRFETPTVPFVKTNSAVIASSWTDLIDGTLTSAIDRTPGNAYYGGGTNSVASNVATNGTAISTAVGAHCSDYASSGTQNTGNPDATGSTWTNNATGQNCATATRRYCFEQQTAPTTCTSRGDIYYDYSNNNYRWCDSTYERLMGASNPAASVDGNCKYNPIDIAELYEGVLVYHFGGDTYNYCGQDAYVPIGKRCTECGGKSDKKVMFLTSATYRAQNLGGLAGADAICQGLAERANLNGTYKAWLAGSDPNSAPATSFSAALKSDAFSIVRTDGTTIATNWSDLIDGSALSAHVDITEFGDVRKANTALARTNVTVFGTQDSATNHCSDFTSAAGSTTHGTPTLSTAWTKSSAATGASSCNIPRHHYCFEQ